MMLATEGKPRTSWRIDRTTMAGAGAAFRVAALAMMTVMVSGGASQPLPEYQVEAAWLLNFARFIEWPAHRFPAAKSPFVLGIVGEDPFGKNLECTLESRKAQGRSFVLKRLSSEHSLKNCHIVFISSSERRKQRELCEKARQSAILTVSDMDDFIANGGMIRFIRKDMNVRFQINLEAAERAGLKFSAQLLKVAETVNGRYVAGKEQRRVQSAKSVH